MNEKEWLASTDPAAMLRLRRTDCCGCLWTDNNDGTVSLCTGQRPCGQCDNGPILPYTPFSDRKLRLFACACCRQVWDRLTDDAPCRTCSGGRWQGRNLNIPGSSVCPDCKGTGRVNRSRRAVEVAERFADGEADLEHDITRAQDDIDLAFVEANNSPLVLMASWTLRAAHDGARRVAESPLVDAATKAAILRDIVGNPFRPVLQKCNDGCRVLTSGRGDRPHRCHTHNKDVEYVGTDKRKRYAVCPDSREYFRFWHCTPTVINLAEDAYRERSGRKCERCNGEGWKYPIPADWDEQPGRRSYKHYPHFEAQCPHCHGNGRTDDGSLDPDRLAVLSDALGDAGCEHERVLTHLRSPGPHYRGMWSLDLILTKE